MSLSRLLVWPSADTALPPFPQASDAASGRGGMVDVRVLSDRWVCVVLDTTAEVLAERDKQFADVMRADKAKHDADPKDWYYAFSAKYHTLLALSQIRPRLVKQHESSDTAGAS